MRKVEEMTKVLENAKIKALGTLGSLNDGFGYWYAKVLTDAGYGNINQAIKEFAKKLKTKIQNCDGLSNLDDYAVAEVFDNIDELIKEFYGDNNNEQK